MDIKENSKKLYLKVEDSWFAALDKVDNFVPVYKVIDPIEKKGIPSLPLSIALILIIISSLFFFIGSGGVTFGAQIVDNAGELRSSTLTIFDEAGKEVTSLNSDDGLFEIKLKEGNYYVSIESENCTKVENKELLVEEAMALQEYKIECQGIRLMSDASFCFSPSEVGEVTIKTYRSGLVIDSSECGTDTCTQTIGINKLYKFTTDEFESNSLSYEQLLPYVNSEIRCIDMDDKNKQPENLERVEIKLFDEDKEIIKSAIVQLVNPSNPESILYKGVTDEDGRAIIKAAFGTKFIIKVLGTTNTATYIHYEEYEVPLGGLSETIIIDRSASSKIIVESKEGLGTKTIKGAIITLINLDTRIIENTEHTSSDGTVTFGVIQGKEYKVSTWKMGYSYSEKNIEGGEDHTFEINEIDKKQTGSILVKALLEGEPIKNARIILKEPSEIPVGIYASLTNTKGLTEFSYIPSGEYCLTVNRNIGEESECTPVTVIIGETTEVEINLQKINFEYNLTITDDGNPAANANVIIYDKDSNEITSGKTDENGFVSLDLQEGITPIISVIYENGGRQYVTEEILEVVEKALSLEIEITPLIIEAHLLGIRTSGGSSSKYITDDLIAGAGIYEAIVAIGLPDYKGNKWNKVSFEIRNEEGVIEFYQGTNNLFEPIETDERLSTRSFVLEKDYGAQKTINLVIPLRIRGSTASTGNYSIKTKAIWESGTEILNYPEEGYEETEVKVSAENCEGIGEFFVCSTIRNKNGLLVNPKASSSLEFEVGDFITTIINITNEGTDDFTGTVKFEDIEQGMKFEALTDIKAITTAGEMSLSHYEFTDYGITVNFDDSYKIAPLDNAKIEFTGTAIKPVQSKYKATIGGSQKELDYLIPITGTEDIILDVTESKVYDLTNELTFSLKSVERNETISVEEYAYDLNSKLTGDIEGGDISLIDSSIVQIDRSLNEITVTFTNTKHLKETGTLTIQIRGDYVEDIDWEVPIESCIKNPMADTLYISQTSPCQIFFTTGDYMGIGAETPGNIYCSDSESIEDAGPWQITFESACGAIIDSSKSKITLDESKITEEYLPVSFLPEDGILSAGESSFRVTYEGTASVTAAPKMIPIIFETTFVNGGLEKQAIVSLEIIASPTISTDESVFDGAPFHPLKTTSLSEPNCVYRYCTVEQFAKWLKLEYFDEDKEIGTVAINLIVDSSPEFGHPLTLQDLAKALQLNSGKGAEIIPADGQIDESKSNTISINPDAILEVVKVIKGQRSTFTIDKLENGNYYIERIEESSTNEIKKLYLRDTVIGMQLQMPYTTTSSSTLGTELYKKSSLGYTIEADGGDLTEEQKTSIGNLFNNAISAMYKDDLEGVDFTPTYSTDAYGQVVLGVCDKLSDNYQTNKEDLTTICGKLYIYSGRSDYSGIILKDEYGITQPGTGKIYFIGTSVENLENMINRFTSSILIKRNGQTPQQLQVNIKEVCLDEEEAFECDNTKLSFRESTFLSVGSNKFKFHCIGHDCSAIEGTEFEDSLRDLGSKAMDYEKEEIVLILTHDIMAAHLTVVNPEATDLTIAEENDFELIMSRFRESVGPDFEIPSDGYYFETYEKPPFRVVLATDLQKAAEMIYNQKTNVEVCESEDGCTLLEVDSQLKQALLNGSVTEEQQFSKVYKIIEGMSNCYLDFFSDSHYAQLYLDSEISVAENPNEKISDWINLETGRPYILPGAEYHITVKIPEAADATAKSFIIYMKQITEPNKDAIFSSGRCTYEGETMTPELVKSETTGELITLGEYELSIGEIDPIYYTLGERNFTADGTKYLRASIPEEQESNSAEIVRDIWLTTDGSWWSNHIWGATSTSEYDDSGESELEALIAETQFENTFEECLDENDDLTGRIEEEIGENATSTEVLTWVGDELGYGAGAEEQNETEPNQLAVDIKEVCLDGLKFSSDASLLTPTEIADIEAELEIRLSERNQGRILVTNDRVALKNTGNDCKQMNDDTHREANSSTGIFDWYPNSAASSGNTCDTSYGWWTDEDIGEKAWMWDILGDKWKITEECDGTSDYIYYAAADSYCIDLYDNSDFVDTGIPIGAYIDITVKTNSDANVLRETAAHSGIFGFGVGVFVTKWIFAGDWKIKEVYVKDLSSQICRDKFYYDYATTSCYGTTA